MTAAPTAEPTDLDRRLAAYEAARRADAPADLAAFLPPPGDPAYRDVLLELVRVDLEYGWAAGRPRPASDYFGRFPELGSDPAARRAVLYEEQRQRDASAETGPPTAVVPAAGDIADGPATDRVAVPAHAGGVDPARAPAPRLPVVGETFLGFELIAELGRGTFGCVFLAKQGRLAGRPVALKVSSELFAESQTLAQLQHTNIVPIYSAASGDGLQALCMPYFGRTTLADVLRDLRGRKALPTSGHHFVSTLQDRAASTRTGDGPAAEPAPEAAPHATNAELATLERSSYVDAVLWLAARLAAGLHHAHERGVVHRDLKPANVLLTDDGQPMLLDFNLAENARRAARHGVGGTLPYMAPEQLRVFRDRVIATPDGRSDLYALGLILFEMLTGRPAFPSHKGHGPATFDAMLADRAGPPPRLRPFNPSVSPAAEALVRRCLEPDPANRHRTAAEFQEDVEAHLAHRPLVHTREPSRRERLRKWARRHPRLSSSASVAALAGVLLAGVGGAAYRYREAVEDRKAIDARAAFLARADALTPELIHPADFAALPPADRVNRAKAALAAYRADTDPAWQSSAKVTRLGDQRDELVGRVGEYLLLVAEAERGPGTPEALRAALALNDRAGDCFAPGARPLLWARQRRDLLAALGDPAAAALVPDAAAPRTAHDQYLVALDYERDRRFADAAAACREALEGDPTHFRARFLLGNSLARLDDLGGAAAAYAACLSRNPDHARARLNHGKMLFKARQFAFAHAEFTKAVGLDPELVEARIDRAQAAALLGGKDRLAEARADLTAVLERPDAPTYAYFRRAAVRQRLGDRAGAADDRAEGLKRRPDDEVSWVTRGLNRLPADPAGALDDFREAEKLNPRSFFALQNQAHVLSDHLKRDADALAVCDVLIGLYPQSHQARAGRAVLLARAGKVEAALADVEKCLAGNPSPLTRYQLAGVYALTADRPGHKTKALKLLADSLAAGTGWTDLPNDPDLLPLREDGDFHRLRETAELLKRLSR